MFKKVICQTCIAVCESKPDNENLANLDLIQCPSCKTYSLMTLEEWTKEKNKELGTNIKPEEVEKYVDELAGNIFRDFDDREPTVEKYTERYGEEFEDFITILLENDGYRQSYLTAEQTDLYIESAFANATYLPEMNIGWDGNKYFKRRK